MTDQNNSIFEKFLKEWCKTEKREGGGSRGFRKLQYTTHKKNHVNFHVHFVTTLLNPDMSSCQKIGKLVKKENVFLVVEPLLKWGVEQP